MPVAAARCIAGRDLAEARLSPDGETVAFTTSARSGAVLAVVPAWGGVERILSTVPVRPGRGLGGGCHDWLPDGSGLIVSGGDGDLWLQPSRAQDARRLTDDGRGRQAPASSPDGTQVATVVDMAEVWVVETATGTARRVDDGGDAFVVDPVWSPDGTVLAWQAWSPPHMAWDESVVVVASAAATSPRVLRRIGEPGTQNQQPRFAPDGSLLRLCDATGWLNLWRDDAPLVEEPFEHGGPTWGLGQRSFSASPDGAHVAFTRNEGGFGRLCVVEVVTGSVTTIARAVHGQLDWRGGTLVALRTGARTPTSIVAYSMARSVEPGAPTRTVLAVGPVAAWDDEPACIEPDLVTGTAGDGHTIHARLYRAVGGHERGPICWVHGGPTDQWQVTFMPRLAYWVSRGFSVLVPDHRGSTGHGRDYQQAMAGRWGDLDVADVASLLSAAHERGDGSPATTVLMGSSAGGMTALLVAARHPSLAVGAAVAYPVCDIAALDGTTHRFEAHYNDTLVGPADDPTAAAARSARSPVAHAVALAAVPLLVLHGDQDPVVPIDQSEDLVEAIRAHGGDVELVVYPGEGHGFRSPENQLDEYARVTAFVDRLL